MINRYMDGDSAAGLLERRWFATFKAASSARAECEALLETIALTEAAWNHARARLSALEKLRDTLGDELAALDEREGESIRHEPKREVSAA